MRNSTLRGLLVLTAVLSLLAVKGLATPIPEPLDLSSGWVANLPEMPEPAPPYAPVVLAEDWAEQDSGPNPLPEIPAGGSLAIGERFEPFGALDWVLWLASDHNSWTDSLLYLLCGLAGILQRPLRSRRGLAAR